MKRRWHDVGDVVSDQLCNGCGACAYICPKANIRLVDVVTEGIRPVIVQTDACATCHECLEVCPGIEVDHREINRRPGTLDELIEFCGPVLSIWEGHASDPEIRFRGSSGGALTALAWYGISEGGMHGVLHIGMDPSDPTRNRTTLSKSRAELLANAGSRYAAASACDHLDLIEKAPRPCIFIGQPSEVSALRKAQRLRAALDRNVGVALSFFCAGSPARQGTIDLLAKIGVQPSQLAGLRYRGNGWPGEFVPTLREGSARSLSYQESWAFIQSYRPLSTHLSPDGTGEDADISCGDPWYRQTDFEEPGRSLIVVRSEVGRAFLSAAAAAGYLTLTPAEPWKLLASQRNLIRKRGAVGGRVATRIVLGLPVPRLLGFSLWTNWKRLSFREKMRSTVGTIRRLVKRGHFRRRKARSPNND